MRHALRSRSLANWADLVLISTGIALSQVAYSILFPANYAFLTRGELAGGFLVSLVTFWAALRLCEGTGPQETWPLLLEQFCVGTGLSLVLDALFNYFQLLTRSFFLIVVGALLAACLLGIARQWIYPRVEGSAAGVLMIGFDPLANQVARSLGQPILGVVGAPASSVPSGIPFLGEVRDFEKIVSERRPAHILIASRNRASIPSPSVLLKLRLRGIAVSDVPALYERLFERVYCRGLDPADMLLSPALCADSRTLAIQAVYTNLIGLFFLIALSPVLAIVTVAILLLAGPGPAIESVECSGFQKIPFRLLRFRTLRNDGSGSMSGVGRVLARLHLVNLPRLINIVRGEIALFGPRPVRREFAQRLTEIMPFYSIRFFVKPGIFGCGQAQLHPATRPVCELSEIEYDLYYIKQASLLFDLEILIRTLSGVRRTALPASEFAGAL
jgi:lipopolysaccharide/colanic/teichoic acid biosynthesis glycosyltransferase